MKKSTLALSALTLALAAGLSACGGGSSTYTIGGVVTGLEFPGLVLSNKGEDLAVGPAGYDDVKDAAGKIVGRTPKNVDYAFKNQADYGDTYDVTVKTQPLHQICVLGGGNADTAGRLSVINAVISCALVDNPISGTVTGLTGDNLVLTNGGTAIAIAKDTSKASIPFIFPQEVTYGQTYGITVLRQPDGQTCTVANGAGEMGDDPVTTVAVTCSPNA